MDISTARDLLASRRQLERRGVTARDLAARVGRGELVRLDHSCYMDASSWSVGREERTGDRFGLGRECERLG